MKITRQDVFTPANLLTAAGFSLTVIGSLLLDRPLGLALAWTGRLMDIFDGRVARRTHTSDFGALLDVTADKFAGLALILGAFYYQLAPLTFLAFVLTSHFFIFLLSFGTHLRHAVPYTTPVSKNNMFLSIGVIILFVLGNQIPGRTGELLGFGATCLAVLAVAYGLATLFSYFTQFMVAGQSRN